MAMGVLTSYAIVLEKRWLSIVFAVFNGVLFIIAIVFSIMAFLGGSLAIGLSKNMLERGIARYTVLNDSLDRNAAKWRFVVDQIQMQGQCCGFGVEGYGQYTLVLVIKLFYRF